MVFLGATVDGRNPVPPGMYKTLVNSGINYQPQLVSRISEPSTEVTARENQYEPPTVTLGTLGKIFALEMEPYGCFQK